MLVFDRFLNARKAAEFREYVEANFGIPAEVFSDDRESVRIYAPAVGVGCDDPDKAHALINLVGSFTGGVVPNRKLDDLLATTKQQVKAELRETLGERWQGPGPLIVLRDAGNLTTLIHELAHILPPAA